MNSSNWIYILENIFLVYFFLFHVGYLSLTISAMFSLPGYLKRHSMEDLIPIDNNLIPPISILVPAYNEEASIAQSIHSLLQLQYPEYEVIVINDGSKDGTLQNLINEFGLMKFPEAYRVRLNTKPIKDIYLSSKYANFRVIDKENGGKADSLNAGLNAAKYPLFCGIDADSLLQRDSLKRVTRAFVEDATTVASGGTIRIANGCVIEKGHLIQTRLPKNFLALLQVAEYLRAFLFGRLGWSPLNALLIISGAFGVFRKETVISVGGYLSDTVGEDMELIVRMHRLLRKQKIPYKITFVPDPVCLTEAPEDLRTLKNQRIRWQRGLSESLTKNMSLLFSSNGGATGWLAFPFFMIFEWLGPLIEVFAYFFVLFAYFTGFINQDAFLLFLLIAIGFGVLLSMTAVFLDELSFRSYPKYRDLLIMTLVSIVENLGYRQLNSIWRLMGLYYWAVGTKGHWGAMKRKTSWK